MTLILVFWGVWSATKLPIDAVPDITNNQVQIYTTCPTLASQEVEQLVTFPIEQSIANIQDIEEVRSISRFGLSVVTVVFKEHVDIYFARQLINEGLKEAVENIPNGIGSPELAPVSTGLGEVYQYIIHPKKGSENKYTTKELRTMQDWIVARQLYGTPGVAEVNSFGGELKQYEVSINPDRLRAMGISIPEIFDALENNNQNTGGAYIDKKPNAYFIRGIGMAKTLEDIGNIAIKTDGSIPIFIKDVATVQYGHAVRYGALTYNGEVDAVGGVVMMLKRENSNEVVKRIKEKLPVIQQSLPDDVSIEPYLDRTDLVNRAIGTVEKNLIEGALIVIFVLVVFLGNMRAGLIVASAIPLSLLFALGMMNVFGVSANLMSLGAIDFGLIVDGAVIIVEATLHHLGLRKSMHKLSQSEMDEEVYSSASKIRHSAAFGEIIILIVYLPILTLVGIEGKMFTPMAKTVGFAILGAFILSLTYIPMMSALFLSKKFSHKKTFSDKMILFFERIYTPLLKKAIRVRYVLVAVAVGIFGLSLFLFRNMGGEFIPQLEEGDFAFHCILPQGSSLSQSIEVSMHASRIIKSFDEVKMVVGKTGSPEVPTDPMPPEITDLIVVLKPKSEWKVQKSYSELGDEILEKLSIIPGIFFEQSQPIQMRFNELMTGVRQDVAVKIFGENLDTLAYFAQKTSDVISQVQGVGQPQVEKIEGLPQINVIYDRTRIANYGLNISDINDILSTAFAGKRAGYMYENERRFDLVVRLDSIHRTDIEDVKNLMIPTKDGFQIPLSQVADVRYELGPAQISRESGKRRVVVGFNLDGRDVQSVVNDIKEQLAKEVQLPTGYYFTYGGQFENLQKASNRLLVAVPVALLLIFTLLYFTFHSVKQGLLIFTAIPMSAIGGVFALLIRDMPFSISAGIGFIALFGVAVLNGIVLIGTFNQLEKEGEDNIMKRVLEGTKIRLRPVLMTATVASLGFLPMALSTSAGAEVQKPLATVVIGGLITATLLTLFVLPLLYVIFNPKQKIKLRQKEIIVLLVIGLMLGWGQQSAQAQRMSLEQVKGRALDRNLQLENNTISEKVALYQSKTAMEIPKTGIFVENDDMQPTHPKGEFKVGISQSVDWPGLYAARKKYLLEQLEYVKMNKNLLELVIEKEVTAAYYKLWFLQEKHSLLIQLDSLYVSSYKASALRFKTGDIAKIDELSNKTKMLENQTFLHQNNQETIKEQLQLMVLLNTTDTILPLDLPMDKVMVSKEEGKLHPELELLAQKVKIAGSNIDVVRNANRPDFSASVYSQRIWGEKDPYSGFTVTASFPIFGIAANKNKVKAAQLEKEQEQKSLEYKTLGGF